MASLQSRKDELLAKKAKLAELRRQRELRQEQLAGGRQSLGGELSSSPAKTAEQRRSEIDSLVSSLIDGRKRESTSSPSKSRPSSYYGTDAATQDATTDQTVRQSMVSSSTQTSETPASTQAGTEIPPPPPEPAKPKPEYITYSKGVQTDPVADAAVGPDDDLDNEIAVRTRRRSSRRQKEMDEEIRASLRKEIEEELKVTRDGASAENIPPSAQQRFPLRQLTSAELNAVTASDDFISFVERSSKVIERALDEDYDLLADYTRTATVDTQVDYTNKSSQSLRETLQLYSANHSKRRMITDLHFSPHFQELLLTSYTKNPSAPNEPNGLVLLWNTHAPSRPEYVFNASSDVLTARFSPFHPNLVVGGCYNGQVCIWDTRSSHRNGQPERRTPPSAGGTHLGHTHPIFSLSVVGTPNAHNILTADTEGAVCSWSVDMLTQAQEYLYLSVPPPSKTEDLAPKTMSFPSSDPTFFLVGSEEGTIYPCHRYDRAGAKAGVDARLAYKSHTAPIMSTQYHPGRGPVDIGDLMLSSSSDWTVKLWRVKPAAATTSAAVPNARSVSGTHMISSDSSSTAPAVGALDPSSGPESVKPLLTIPLESIPYNTTWHPTKPSVFAACDGNGYLSVFDLLSPDLEIPVARAQPSKSKTTSSTQNPMLPFKGLNKCAWEERTGRHIATGGLDGVVTLFEVGRGLWANAGEVNVAEWQRTKSVVNRLEAAAGGTVV